ncbi:MAG: excinuclease ABC subunit UvrC [Crocinitomicaceae bacterium]|nr:excinuclease ABC subunit UvrC [Crocinitomicaceae bacterium]
MKSILKVLPKSPGVYQFFDKNDKVIYVGKAKNLKNRVSSYFNKQQYENAKTKLLVKHIVNIEYIVVDTEQDALLLENSLIKKFQPKYNIQLKDDKTYPWICIKNERFPRVFSTRNVIKDGSDYFGPFTSVKVMNTMLELFRQIYPLRTCNLNLSQQNIESGKLKVCLEYHLGKCKAPCIAEESETNYNGYIEEIKNILKGNVSSVISRFKDYMQELSENYEFEEAQKVKLKIDLLKNFQTKSTIVNPKINNLDVITAVEDIQSAYVNYLRIINGAIIQAHTVEVKKKMDESIEEILSHSFLELKEKLNSNCREVLVQIPLNIQFDEVHFVVPQRGDKKTLLDLSLRNAKYFMMDQHKKNSLVDPNKNANRVMTTLQKDLSLKELPVHIECFDNSNIQGTNPVAACVVFKNAKPSKKDYRHFNIKTVEGPNDFASMEEVVFRRYKRLLDEGESLPQLIIIDGGKGQLSSALKSLDELNLRGKIAIVGIAKKLEEIYFPGDSLPIYIDKKSESLKLIQHLRNEAHRFGITHHRNRRSKSSLVSELTQIEGVGPTTHAKLIKQFKSAKRVKEASIEELTSTIGASKANIVFEYFHK